MSEIFLPLKEMPSSCSKCKVSIQHRFGGNLFIKCPNGIIGTTLGESEDVYNKVHPNCPLKSIDIDELEKAVEEYKPKSWSVEAYKKDMKNYNTIKSTIDKLKGEIR